MALSDRDLKIEYVTARRSKVVYLKSQNNVNMLAGSSRYVYNEYSDKVEVKSKQQVKKNKIEVKSKLIDTEKKPRMYTLNKSYLKDKILAFSKLKRSKSFMAFWTISFPEGLGDKEAHEVLNNVFTNIRNLYRSFSYIYVAERQKNGTIHFHVFVNMFLNVRIINYKFAQAIENVIVKYKLFSLNFDKKMYNGFDTRSVYNINQLHRYVSKYVTKQDSFFLCKAYSMSYDISSLFVSQLIDMPFFESIYNKMTANKVTVNRLYYDYHDIFYFYKDLPDSVFKLLDSVNESIYNFLKGAKESRFVKNNSPEGKQFDLHNIYDLSFDFFNNLLTF